MSLKIDGTLLLAGLTHPNLPRIYEQFTDIGRWYLVMDFIEGETLEEHLSKVKGGKLPVEKVLIRDKCARARFQRMRPRSLLLLVPRKILGAGENLVKFPRFLALRAKIVPRGVTHKLKKTWVVAVLVLL